MRPKRERRRKNLQELGPMPPSKIPGRKRGGLAWRASLSSAGPGPRPGDGPTARGHRGPNGFNPDVDLHASQGGLEFLVGLGLVWGAPWKAGPSSSPKSFFTAFPGGEIPPRPLEGEGSRGGPGSCLTRFGGFILKTRPSPKGGKKKKGPGGALFPLSPTRPAKKGGSLGAAICASRRVPSV